MPKIRPANWIKLLSQFARKLLTLSKGYIKCSGLKDHWRNKVARCENSNHPTRWSFTLWPGNLKSKTSFFLSSCLSLIFQSPTYTGGFYGLFQTSLKKTIDCAFTRVLLHSYSNNSIHIFIPLMNSVILNTRCWTIVLALKKLHGLTFTYVSWLKNILFKSSLVTLSKI